MKTLDKAITIRALVEAALSGTSVAYVGDLGDRQYVFQRCQYANATEWALAVIECAKRAPMGHAQECASNRMAQEGKPCNEEDGRGVCDCGGDSLSWRDRVSLE